LPPDLPHERVEGEWSFLETLSHLVPPARLALNVRWHSAFHDGVPPWLVEPKSSMGVA
jgi:hypothetical protein